jgi:hypothetical protein
MESGMKAIQAALSFLAEYPSWVRVLVVVWLLLTAAIIGVLVIAAPSKERPCRPS